MNLVFIHGSGLTGEVWHQWAALFPVSDAINLPGHPEGEGCKSVPAYVEWLRRYVKQRDYDDLVLVGSSLGGAIVQLYALSYPLGLRAIGLVGTGARLRVAPHILQPLEEDYAIGARLFTDLSLSLHADPSLKRRLLRWMLQVAHPL